MKVLVIGSGGREHALAWKIRQSPHVSWLGVAPGNGGTSMVGENVDVFAAGGSEHLIDAVKNYVEANEVNLVVVGPEDPLAMGIADVFDPEKVFVFGPSCAAARIESDKKFAKDLMIEAGVPTAEYRGFNVASTAKEWVLMREAPMVVKATGLAAGKGVFVCRTRGRAIDAVEEIMEQEKFGQAGEQIIIEDCLEGPEASLMVITDGDHYVTLPPSQDHKRIGEGDTGPNTGGMGAYAPAPVMTDELVQQACTTIIEPVLQAMRDAGTPYKGVLYAGLMLTDDGPKVLEFNCRFGDPETQAVLPLLGVDLVDLLLLACTGKMGLFQEQTKLEPHDWKRISKKGFAANVVLAAGGYPGSYKKGMDITGLPTESEDLVVFHAGTRQEGGRIQSSGGRVLSVTGWDMTLEAAFKKAYEAADSIQFENKYQRRDIGWRELTKDE